jgi:hypothetical protein
VLGLKALSLAVLPLAILTLTVLALSVLTLAVLTLPLPVLALAVLARLAGHSVLTALSVLTGLSVLVGLTGLSTARLTLTVLALARHRSVRAALRALMAARTGGLTPETAAIEVAPRLFAPGRRAWPLLLRSAAAPVLS